MVSKKKTEVISLRKWLLSGNKFEHIIECSGCRETSRLEKFQDLFYCNKCGLDLRTCLSKVKRFTIWKQEIIPVFLWSDPIRTIRKKKVKAKVVSKRKSFDE